jgi:hypothetical protein
MRLLAFPDSLALPQVTVFWIRLDLINQAFYCPHQSSGTFTCNNLSTIPFLSPTWIRSIGHPLECGRVSTGIPVSFSPEPHFGISQPGHRIQSALSYQKLYLFFKT